MTEYLLDPEFGSMVISNDSPAETRDVIRALNDQRPEIAALARWSAQAQGFNTRAGGLFERDRYVVPDEIYKQMCVAAYAAEFDDVVAGVIESTEALAFSKVSFWCEDPEQEDVWNQIAADLNLDSRLREIWRELFIYSQAYVAVWWTTKTYKVRGKTDKGNQKRRTFKNLRVPEAMTLLDPLKIVPVGNFNFNKERLAWIADREEAVTVNRVLENPAEDQLMSRLFLRPYELTTADEKNLKDSGFEVGRGAQLFELNPDVVFRHTATRSQYQPFAAVRMKSVFELLDMKSQLRQMDRAHLLGGTNFIVLITKGTDDLPAKPAEIANLQTQVRTVARVPILVGDHRLKVEIITPKLDQTLRPERYNTIDARLSARLYQIFLLGLYHAGASGDDSSKLIRVVAQGMEGRRQMIKRTLEAEIFDKIQERNPELSDDQELRFHPKKIALDFDANFASFMFDMRESNEISRDTFLSQFDIDQSDEFKMRKREEELYDDTFQTAVPFNSPLNAPGAQPGGAQPVSNAVKKSAGRRQGGNRGGGGAAPGSGQGQAPKSARKKSDRGRSTPQAASEEDPE